MSFLSSFPASSNGSGGMVRLYLLSVSRDLVLIDP